MSSETTVYCRIPARLEAFRSAPEAPRAEGALPAAETGG